MSRIRRPQFDRVRGGGCRHDSHRGCRTYAHRWLPAGAWIGVCKEVGAWRIHCGTFDACGLVSEDGGLVAFPEAVERAVDVLLMEDPVAARLFYEMADTFRRL